MEQIIPPSKTSHPNFWKIGFILETIILIIIILLSWQWLYYYQTQNDELLSKNKRGISGSENPPTPSPQIGNSGNKNYVPLKIEAWEQFSDQSFDFTFKYPKGWVIEKSEKTSLVTVGNYPLSCKNCSSEERKNFYLLYIEKFTGQTKQDQTIKTTDIQEYLYRDWLKYQEEEKASCQTRESCPPRIPGYTSEYLGYERKTLAGMLFRNANVTTAEIEPFPSTIAEIGGAPEGYDSVINEYLVIDSKFQVYKIGLISPGYPNPENQPREDVAGHPIIDIVKSLRFNH